MASHPWRLSDLVGGTHRESRLWEVMMKNAPHERPDPEEQQILQLVLRAMREIRYGSVQIVIQDSKVVQIDKVEKLRLV
jgi:hypothetical protein